METYLRDHFYIQSRAKPLVFALASLLTGGSSLLLGRGLDNRSGQIFSMVIGIVFILMTILLLRTVCTLTVHTDGTIVLRCVIGSTRIAARDIRRLEGLYVTDDDGDRSWQLHIYATSGHVEVEQFEYVKDFVGQVRRHNPMMEWSGMWPRGSR